MSTGIKKVITQDKNTISQMIIFSLVYALS